MEATLTDEQLAALDFETAQARLEEIVGELEQGRLPLEQSLALYQLGLRLRDHCRARLAAVEAALEQLREGSDGTLSVEETETWE